MSIAEWFIVICFLIAFLGIMVFGYTMSHPRRRGRRSGNPKLMYDLDSKKWHIFVTLNDHGDDEEK